jgi:hypothetical protein
VLLIVQIYLIFVKSLIWDLEERKTVVLQEKKESLCVLQNSLTYWTDGFCFCVPRFLTGQSEEDWKYRFFLEMEYFQIWFTALIRSERKNLYYTQWKV